jgi:hypothetical protein
MHYDIPGDYIKPPPKFIIAILGEKLFCEKSG